MTRWTARFRGPAILVRGQDSVLSVELWGKSGIQEPDSGTITVYDSEDTVIVSAQAVTIDTDDHVVTATIDAGDLPSTLSFSDAWRVEWSFTIGSETVTFYQDAQLVRRRWTSSVVPDDLIRTAPQLSNAYDPDDPNDNEALEKIIRQASEDTQARLAGNGSRPSLIFDAWKLNSYTICVCLGRIFRAHEFDSDPANLSMLESLAAHFEEAAETAWAQMNFRYDSAETGKGGDQEQKRGPGIIRLGITR